MGRGQVYRTSNGPVGAPMPDPRQDAKVERQREHRLNSSTVLYLTVDGAYVSLTESSASRSRMEEMCLKKSVVFLTFPLGFHLKAKCLMNRCASLVFVAMPVLLVPFLLSGCSPKKLPAYGAANEITIVTNLDTEDEAVVHLKSAFAKPLITVDEDTSYIMEIISAGEFAKYSRRYDASRNLVMLVDITKQDNLTKKIQDLLGTRVMNQIQEGPGEYFIRSNVWALAQTLTVIAGAGRESLTEVIKARGDRLYAEMDSLVTERTKEAVFVGGEQTSVTSELASKYGWSLRVPPGFKPVELDTIEPGMLLRLRADEPTRLLFVYWMPFEGRENGPLDPQKCLELRARLVWVAHDQDAIDFARTAARGVVFQGRDAIKIEGIWQNKKYVIGGPFFSYCFLRGNRFYMIDAVIFAPGTRKGALFKQLEAIMMTFKG